MKVNVWYSVDNQIVFVITRFVIDDKKSIAKAFVEIKNFVKKYPLAFKNSRETGILLSAQIKGEGDKYYKINTTERLNITAYIRNYIDDLKAESSDYTYKKLKESEVQDA